MLQDQCDQHASQLETGAPPSRAAHGNIRLFFAGSGGLTAMRKMLETALALRRQGVDVVVGPVLADEREPLNALLSTFETLAPADDPGDRGSNPRIDVDAVIRRAPAIILVDTRTSARPLGSRFVGSNYRCDPWTDIETIVQSGVSVWAAVDATGFSSWTSVGAGIPARLSGVSLL